MPQRICTRLQRIQRQLLWGGGNLEKKPHLVKWATVCTEKKKWGLGVRNFSRLNRVLLCKWSWRFANERHALWRKVISYKCEETLGGWHTCDIRGGFGVGLWKEIKKEWPLFLQNAAFALGNGRRISFWKDVWCGEEALCFSFPSMFLLAVQKDAMVADLWNWVREEGGWSPTFLRSFNDWEMEEVESFLSSIHKKKIKPGIEDKLLMKGSNHGNFSIRTLYSGLDFSPKFDFPFCSVWNYVIPSKISFFA